MNVGTPLTLTRREFGTASSVPRGKDRQVTRARPGQVDTAARVITVDRKVAEVAGHLYLEAPKNRKYRKTIYPRLTPAGYPLADRLAARIKAASAEQATGINPLGLIFPSPKGKHWRSSNFQRNVLQRAYLAAGWRDADGNGRWIWHSLRHVFCTTALFTWKLDATDVSRMAGSRSPRQKYRLLHGQRRRPTDEPSEEGTS